MEPLLANDDRHKLEGQAIEDEDEDERLRRFIAEELNPRDVWARRP